MGRIIGGISIRFVGVRGSVNCNFIINFILLSFLDFHGVGGVGGKFTIFSMNMGDWSQWIQHLGRKRRSYQRWVNRVHGRC